MRAALQRLADLAADAEGQPRRRVPDVGEVALVDQLAVLVDDACRAGVEDAVVGQILTELTAALALRPLP